MKKLGVLTVALVLVLGVAGSTLAQTPSPPGGMMGKGLGPMGQSKMGGQAGAMPCGTTGAAAGQPLPQEQLEQFATQHGITVDQAKDMAKRCPQMMQTPPSKAQ